MPAWCCRKNDAVQLHRNGNEQAENQEARMNIARGPCAWQPPESIARDEIVARSAAILGRPELPLRQSEDIFRIHALGLDWEIGRAHV